MSQAPQLSELEQQHKALELKIRDELSQPNSDERRVAELKRQKLLLKDQIARMQPDADREQTVH
jgi:hypothetical protein